VRQNRYLFYMMGFFFLGFWVSVLGGGGGRGPPPHDEDRGDGLIMVMPPEVPTSLLIEPIAEILREMLRLHNRRHSELSRIRLRMSVHAGHVAHDGKGLVGRTPVHLTRLLDASEFKRELVATTADLGLIVSARVYDEVVMDPEPYRSIVVENKETTTVAWVRLSPGSWLAVIPAPRAEIPHGVHTPGAGVRNIGSTGRVPVR
jgi:hypothetical protein